MPPLFSSCDDKWKTLFRVVALEEAAEGVRVAARKAGEATGKRWKRQVEQNAFLQNQVSVLKSRLDTLDAEKLISEQKAATWNVRLVYATIGATAAWVVNLTLT